jgi:hypothetical protein
VTAESNVAEPTAGGPAGARAALRLGSLDGLVALELNLASVLEHFAGAAHLLGSAGHRDQKLPAWLLANRNVVFDFRDPGRSPRRVFGLFALRPGPCFELARWVTCRS